MRSNTLSVPAHTVHHTPAHRDLDTAVPQPKSVRDQGLLIARAAANPAVSDRAMRVYAIVAAVFDRGVDAATFAATLPNLTEPQAARLLGDLASAGLLDVRRRTIGYTATQARIRRRWYTLAGGAR
jgi:hypothetical protein